MDLHQTTVHMDAMDVTLELLAPGAHFASSHGTFDTVPEGRVGLLIQTGTVSALIVGTPQQLRDRVIDGLHLDVPAGVPLVDVE